jgi:hypothetical protein
MRAAKDGQITAPRHSPLNLRTMTLTLSSARRVGVLWIVGAGEADILPAQRDDYVMTTLMYSSPDSIRAKQICRVHEEADHSDPLL